jgi:hypothetical protein
LPFHHSKFSADTSGFTLRFDIFHNSDPPLEKQTCGLSKIWNFYRYFVKGRFGANIFLLAAITRNIYRIAGMLCMFCMDVSHDVIDYCDKIFSNRLEFGVFRHFGEE